MSVGKKSSWQKPYSSTGKVLLKTMRIKMIQKVVKTKMRDKQEKHHTSVGRVVLEADAVVGWVELDGVNKADVRGCGLTE